MARKTTETPETPKARDVTFSPEALQQVIAEATQRAVDEATASLKAEMQAALAAKPSALNGKSEQSIKNEIAVVKKFKAAGFGNVTPRVDVMTFNRWMAQGFRPVEGSKSLKIRNLRLFHKSQVRKLTAEELKAMQEQSAAAVRRHNAKVIPMTSDASSQ
jgi:uncharacterized protein (DUF4415 family)